jgi:hypothetical protein
VVIIHEVADYKTWRPVFDLRLGDVVALAVRGVLVNESIDNPNLVAVYLAADKAASIHQLGRDAGRVVFEPWTVLVVRDYAGRGHGGVPKR